MYMTLYQSSVSSIHAVLCAGISNENLINSYVYTIHVNVLKYVDGYRIAVNNYKVVK